MKILIIRFSSIGDVVLTSPVIRAIKMEYPSAEIHFLTKQNNVSLLENHPLLTRLWLFKKGNLNTIINALKRQNFDVVIDLHSNFRSRWVAFRLKTKVLRFCKTNVRKWIYVQLKINKLPKLHIVDRYMAPLTKIGVETQVKHLDYYLPENIEKTLSKELLEKSSEPFIAFVLGGQHATKRMPENKIIEIASQLNLPILLLGGHDELNVAKRITKALPDCSIVNCCGSLTINQSAFIIKQSTKVITGDTGLMHIAAAFQKPIASIWGNTVPAFGMYPFGVFEQKQFEVERLNCRPCSKIGFDKCPKDHFKCMNLQNASAIAEWINQ